jgi:hypothetical protein
MLRGSIIRGYEYDYGGGKFSDLCLRRIDGDQGCDLGRSRPGQAGWRQDWRRSLVRADIVAMVRTTWLNRMAPDRTLQAQDGATLPERDHELTVVNTAIPTGSARCY